MNDINSATTIESQMPFSFKKIGKIITALAWKTTVLKKEIKAEISPLFNEVKNDDP